MSSSAAITICPPAVSGPAELIVDGEHLRRVVLDGMLKAKVSLDIATADFKAMQLPDGRDFVSVVTHLVRLARQGVEVRLLHAGVPSGPALRQLRSATDANLTIRRCPRLHAKTVIVDAAAMYLGSANLTGAGLGAKRDNRRNIEWGVWTKAPAMIDAVLFQFNTLWEGRRCEGCGRREVCPVPLEEPQLGPVTASSTSADRVALAQSHRRHVRDKC